MMVCRRLFLLSMLLAAEHHGSTEAFCSIMSIAPKIRRASTAIASTVENVFEQPSQQQQLQDDLPSVTSAEESQSIQLRSVDKDALINTSIFIIAIATVVTTVLSVDVGITRGWTAEEIALRIPLDNWRSYTNILSMAPIETKVRGCYRQLELTKCICLQESLFFESNSSSSSSYVSFTIQAVTSATVYTIGDIIAQKTEGLDIGKLDRGRILRSALAGLIGHGPMSHVWYHVSEDFFDNILHLHAWWDFVPKVVVDQLVFGPIWNNSYILLLGIMQLQKPGQIFGDMKRSTIPLLISGLKLWPFVHCITYGLIPVENRLLWVDLVEILWVTILANEANSEAQPGDDKDR